MTQQGALLLTFTRILAVVHDSLLNWPFTHLGYERQCVVKLQFQLHSLPVHQY